MVAWGEVLHALRRQPQQEGSRTVGSTFREHLLPAGHPRLAGLAGCDACSYADAMRQQAIVGEAVSGWLELFENTKFRGITTDGEVVSGLFKLGAEEHAPTAEALSAADALLAELSEDERSRLTHPIGSKVWRSWMNAEMYVNRFGLRMEEITSEARQRVLDLVRACVSETGYRKVRDAMHVNGFLGELVGLPGVLNENSYNINIFGVPSREQPWGWNLYGHHLCLNCIFIGDQQVFTPVFFGAEPNEIDAGPHDGTAMFIEQERAGLAFARSLPSELAEQAILFRRKRDPGLPPGRLHPGDELHLGGAFQDNRVVGYEGLQLVKCSSETQEQIVALVDLFLDYQPVEPRAARLADVRRHLDDTWFCWIGGLGDDDTFYYRIQSPVIMAEFDHHAGIFLANTEPERFHIHTLVRTPNGNDYGAELVRQSTGTPHLLDGPE